MTFEPLGKILEKTGAGISQKKIQESEELLTHFKAQAAKILPEHLQHEYEIGYVQNGILRLFVTRAAVAQQLQLYKHKILAALAEAEATPTIQQILFQQKREIASNAPEQNSDNTKAA